MKKILGISLVAILAISPMMANAAVTDMDPGATVTVDTLETQGLTEAQAEQHLADITAGAPKYALKQANAETDGNAASAGYVKGAYNAIIKGVNAVQGEIDTLKYNKDHVADNYVEQDDLVGVINSAAVKSIDGAISNGDVAVTTLASTSTNVTSKTATVNVSMAVMDDWENDTEADDPVATNITLTGNNLTVSNLAVSKGENLALSDVSVTKTGIEQAVTVDAYHATAANN